ncbi:ketoacyl-ACP synthase III, partial [Xanthomonas perforans]|nr:ketoacyl-ACP synthase III [Xanthomonas perforans]
MHGGGPTDAATVCCAPSCFESSALNALPLRILGTGRHVPATEVTSRQLDERWQLPAGTTFARLGVE